MNEFRPSKQEKSVISIRLDSELLKTVDEQSTKTNISRNAFIVQCIEFAIKHLNDA